MKGSIGQLLLVVGTVVASLAAAAGEKPWIAQPLGSVALDDPATLLFQDVTSEVEQGAEPLVVAEAGAPVTGAAVEALRAAGAESVRVRRMPVKSELVATSDSEGRVLAEPLYADIASGAGVSREEATSRLKRAAELEAFAVDFEADSGVLPEGGVVFGTTDLDGVEQLSVTTESAPDGARVVGTAADLAAMGSSALVVGIPTMRSVARAGRFVDADLAARLTELGFADVSVNIPAAPWDVNAWGARWFFGGGLLVMVIGVMLMRSARVESALAAAQAAEAGDEASPRESLKVVVERVRAMNAAIAGLSREDLMTSCDALLGEQVFAFGEAKEQLRAELGGRVYAQVMTAFSTGERRLSRAWSAAADGYRDESVQSLAECIEPFETALEALGGKPSVSRTDSGAEYVVWSPGGREN
ncbi:hypothetical protein [Engelhardtia mirabilis]|uniref:DUF4350 domain-containing protein n=1 Tax=Engelhardtia mirabilis TaxID=2528011 RepID=A0A518BLK5_9BACT|nr:hypothetical protein Pla133_29220 [Planctomycetes bacterium Pla133]QDV02159.1 hypothetical protein Pla86_29210 [Planctomycetes bacterium Pla86]